MKKKLILITLIIPIFGITCKYNLAYALNSAESVDNELGGDSLNKITIYGVSWNLRSKKPITIDNIKSKAEYILTINNNYISCLDELFYGFKDCHDYLMEQDTLSNFDMGCIACVILYFEEREITLYFKANACYFYNGTWFKPNYDLFYYIFNFFETDSIMPMKIIKKAKKRCSLNK